MKLAIIGAGNMGGAIARGLPKGNYVKERDIIVSDPSNVKLQELKAQYPEMSVMSNNQEAITDADIIILAVKPWLVKDILSGLEFHDSQIFVSVAAGITFDDYKECVNQDIPLFRVVPNTAISELESMTLIASLNATSEQEELILSIFNDLGLAMMVPENLIRATTALTSCGIAYALKYIQAAMQAGIEMGVYPADVMKMVAQSMKGAAELILNNDTHPSVEIDKVTTPGGFTIKGINELEHAGFTSAIIRAMKASN